MKDEEKTQEQLINDLLALRQRVAELEALEAERQRAEEALRESEERFRQLAENVQDVFWLGTPGTGDQRRVLYASSAFEKIFGVKPEEVYKSDNAWLEVVYEEDRDRVLGSLERFLRDKGDYNVEYRIVRPDGAIRWVWARGFAIRNEKGEIYRTAGLAQDITERKQAEEEIRRLSQFRESIIDNIDVWLDVLDEEANILVWNKTAEEISGYSRHEVVGHGKIWEWLYPDEGYRNGILARVTDSIEREDTETTIRCKDGQTRIVSWSPRKLVDEKGVVMGSIVIGRDITELKRAEEEREKPAEGETLDRLLPICASCKRIRDEEGHWHQIEVYIQGRTGLDFSHSICPDCARRLYPQFFKGEEGP